MSTGERAPGVGGGAVAVPVCYSHPASLEHDPRVFSPGHPDTPERLFVLEAALREHDWLGWERRLAPAAGEEQLELAHSADHVRFVRELCETGGGAIDADTFLGPRSYDAALHTLGGGLGMTKALLGRG